MNAPFDQAPLGALPVGARETQVVGTITERRHLIALLLFALAAGNLISIGIFAWPINHDEGQYVAAIAAMRHGWPYLDFPYLQTPLQPLLFSPLRALSAGFLYLGVRVANGVLGLATLLFVFVALRGRASRRAALITATSLLCCNVFLFASVEARNDTLPMALFAAGIALHLRVLDNKAGDLGFVAAGLLYGLAASAKISFGLPGCAVLLFAARDFLKDPRTFLLLLAGMAAGSAVSLVFAVVVPEHFRFDVFTYSLEAPQQWWRAIGQGSRLHAFAKITKLLKLALPGAMLVASLLIIFDRSRSAAKTLLNLMIVGGLASAYLPDPTFPQYWVPALPPLFIRFGMSLDALVLRLPRILILLVISWILGVAPTVRYAVAAVRSHRSPVIEAALDGREAAVLAAGGRIVTLAPHLVAGADTELDQRFVTGPFLYRTFGSVARSAHLLGHAVNWEGIPQALDVVPPAVVVVGTENTPKLPLFPMGLDEPLVNWARARGYRAIVSRSGQITFYVAPSRLPLPASTMM